MEFFLQANSADANRGIVVYKSLVCENWKCNELKNNNNISIQLKYVHYYMMLYNFTIKCYEQAGAELCQDQTSLS